MLSDLGFFVPHGYFRFGDVQGCGGVAEGDVGGAALYHLEPFVAGSLVGPLPGLGAVAPHVDPAEGFAGREVAEVAFGSAGGAPDDQAGQALGGDPGPGEEEQVVDLATLLFLVRRFGVGPPAPKRTA